MASITSIAGSGMQAAQQHLQASAHNVAYLQTPGFHRQEVTADRMAGPLLDERA